MIARLARAALVALLLAVPLAGAASAHPLGNFSVNRYSRVELGSEQATLRYVLDLAEIPTIQELQAAGLATDAPEDAVRRSILGPRAAAIAERAQLVVGGRRARWDIRESSLVMPEGQAGLRTMRVALSLAAAVAARGGDAVEYRDSNEPGRTGWHELVLVGVGGVELEGSTAASADRSDELRRYPADPTIAPPDVSRASARVSVTAGAAAAREAPAAPGGPRFGVDPALVPVADLLRAGSAGDAVATLLALAAAAAIGAAHAITPGHGKTVMAAYLVGTHGTPRRALALGGVVALSHTSGVLGLGLLILAASSQVAPERFYPYVSAVSALIVLWIGSALVWRLLRGRADRHGHDQGHGHGHRAARAVGWRALVALGVSGGIIPSASALLLLLAAVSLRRPELGLILILAFGAGMAAVLVAVGLMLVGAGRLAARHLGGRPAARRIAALVPAAAAVTVLIVGAGLSVQAGQQLIAALL